MIEVIEDDVAPVTDIAPPPGAPFLTADWRDVIGVTYPCSRDQLTPYLPPGATVDTHPLSRDHAAIYGPSWAWLADTQSSHVSLATGSAITISRPMSPDTRP
jgi:hypothetical protein